MHTLKLRIIILPTDQPEIILPTACTKKKETLPLPHNNNTTMYNNGAKQRQLQNGKSKYYHLFNLMLCYARVTTKILKKIPEHFQNIFQEHVSSSKVSKIYVLVIRRLGALNEYQKQNNINKNMCCQQNINTGRTTSKILTAETIFYVKKDL